MLSLRLSCTEFSALSSGHGLRGLGLQGVSSGDGYYDIIISIIIIIIIIIIIMIIVIVIIG